MSGRRHVVLASLLAATAGIPTSAQFDCASVQKYPETTFAETEVRHRVGGRGCGSTITASSNSSATSLQGSRRGAHYNQLAGLSEPARRN